MSEATRPSPGAGHGTTEATSAVARALLVLERKALVAPGTADRFEEGGAAHAAGDEALQCARFVSICALRNLAALDRLYGAAFGDLARDVLHAVAAAASAGFDPAARLLLSPGPEVLLAHGAATREEAERAARRVRDALAAVALPAPAGVLHLHPLVATAELPASVPSSDLRRVLAGARALAQRSDHGYVFLPAAEVEQQLAAQKRRDARLAIVTEALASGRVEVHYQPVVDIATGAFEDIEALARIRTPEGLMPACEFIDDVHGLGETAALDAHVMRRLGECGALLAHGTRRLFVNVSPLSLGSPEFREVMGATIARLQAEGLRLVLVLELTEQALVEHHDVIRDIHRDHGVTFAVDDFGTGYSSLRTVSELAVQRVISVLKIDGSLTSRIAESVEAYKVVLAVAHLARSLELRVIAEHVETEAVLERLRSAGVECGQGYLFDPPLSAEALQARRAEARALPAAPSRPALALLEPYLHRAFEAFYERLLSDPHFARYFRSPEQVRALVEKQKQTLVESLADEPAALRRRYEQLGRRHAELGLPLASFLTGADIMHEQLLDVLVHATREPAVLRDTERFFARLRHLMARGYLARLLPAARAELERHAQWAARSLAVPPAVRGTMFGCMAGWLDRAQQALAEQGPPRRELPIPAEACPAAPWLDESGHAALHCQLHADAESLDYFLVREEYAAAHAVLEGLLGRFERLLLTLAREGRKA